MVRRREFTLAAGLAFVAAHARAQHADPAGHADHADHADHGASAVAAPRPPKPAKPAKPRPALGVGAAFAPDGELWIVGLDAQRRLFVQRSADAGARWQPPQALAIGDDTPAADGEARPKIAFGPRGQAVISYTQPLAAPYTGFVRMLRSDDGARSFSAPFTVHRDRQPITHRFDAIAFDARGTLHTLWIDKRERQARGTAYRGAAVYRNESRDGGLTFGPDLKLADHSCECCRIALAPSPDGGVVAMWRHVFAPNVRDHAFAPVDDRAPGALPVRASHDGWAIDACPHHGPGLAAADGGGWHTVWFGDRGGVAAVRYGRLDADGAPVGTPWVVPDEGAEHADVSSAGEHVVVAWRSFDGQGTRWRAALSADGGRRFVLRELGRSDGDNDHPRLLRRGHEIHALWRTTEAVHVQRLV